MMSPGRSAGGVAKALLSSYAHPHKIYNYISMHAALVADRLMAKAPAYSAIDWPAALLELSELYPASSGFLLEPQAVQIEKLARVDSQAGSGKSPRAFTLNSDLTLARCLYLLCRALTPGLVVETGVANGLSSAYILQALAVNGSGVLHSIDLPLPSESSAQQIGALVPQELRGRWRLHLGSSRRLLPKIIRAHHIDVFVHDSLHTYRNMSREFGVVWPHLRTGGVLVSDDIEGNLAFSELRLRTPVYWQVVKQEHKPGALFGIAVQGSL